MEQSIKGLATESCKPISEFAQIYQFLLLLERKQSLLGTGVASLLLVLCEHIISIYGNQH